VQATHPSFADFEGLITVPAKGIATLGMEMAERDGTLTLASSPEGAEVLVDGHPVGAAPLADLVLRPGPHQVELRLPEHETETISIEVRGVQATDLGVVELQPCGVLDIGGLPAGAVATLAGRRLGGTTPLPRGTHEVRLTRAGFIPQSLAVELVTGTTVALEPAPWEPSILAEMANWDESTNEARRAAAKRVAARTDGVIFKGLETFEAGGIEREVALYHHDAAGVDMVLVPGGTFLRGSPEDEEGRRADEAQHSVALTLPFLMCRTEVTQAQWERLMGSNPSVLRDPERPVERVSWDEVRGFCDAAGLALPTEAQWEYACRAGSTGRFCYGDDAKELGEYAWIESNSDKHHQPVGRKLPNALGLFDMHGNVWEWCEDGYGPYPEGEVCDPVGDPGADSRVLRGGGFNFSEYFARSAFRRKAPRQSRFISLGFRPVLVLDVE
jgi:formylglycine-generating enzyme required for sulfatase activity